MNFCIISPVSGLEAYSALRRNHLVLAQHLYNKDYFNFYARRRVAGDFLILDNGSYENTRPLDSAAYVNYIKELDPQVAVLPDVLMSPWRVTTSASLRFLDQWAFHLQSLHYSTQWMYVPQTAKGDASDTNPHVDWMRSLETVVDDGRCGKLVTWVGLGRYLATEFINLPGRNHRRATLAREVKTRYPHLKLHALGMASGSVGEAEALSKAGVHSIDSSAPVWRGWNGFTLAQEGWKQRGSPCEFHAPPPSPKAHKLILSNLALLNIHPEPEPKEREEK